MAISVSRKERAAEKAVVDAIDNCFKDYHGPCARDMRELCWRELGRAVERLANLKEDGS